MSSSVPKLSHLTVAPLISEYLADPAEEPAKTELAKTGVFPLMRRVVWAITNPEERRQRLQVIQQRFQNEIESLMLTAWNDPGKQDEIEAQLQPDGPLAGRWLSEMYQNGGAPLNKYTYRMRYISDDAGAKVMETAQTYLAKIKDDFQNGHPHAFPQMAAWMRDRHITYVCSLENEPPFDQPSAMFPLLKKMAYLGVKEAQDALAWACYCNEIGSAMDNISLHLTNRERLDGLSTLAEWGHSSSQERLAEIYCRNDFYLGNRFSLQLSEAERRAGIDQLIQLESEPNYYLTTIFAENKIGDLPCDYSFEERIAHLTHKAKLGDQEAFHLLWKLFAKDQLDEASVPLGLNEEERWKVLEELRTPENEEIYLRSYGQWMCSKSSELLPCRMTIKERIDYLEKLFFEKQNPMLIDTLERCFFDNLWVDYTSKLNIPFQERVEKLQKIAAHPDSENAIKALAELYLPEFEISSENPIDGTAEEKKQIRAEPYEKRLEVIFGLVFQGKHWEFLDQHLSCPLKADRLKKIIELAQAHIEALKDSAHP